MIKVIGNVYAHDYNDIKIRTFTFACPDCGTGRAVQWPGEITTVTLRNVSSYFKCPGCQVMVMVSFSLMDYKKAMK